MLFTVHTTTNVLWTKTDVRDAPESDRVDRTCSEDLEEEVVFPGRFCFSPSPKINVTNEKEREFKEDGKSFQDAPR
jgi:hypothetical protein